MWELSQIAALLQKRERARRVYTSLWVTAREAFWIALEALRTHKLRSFLTLLGVVIATTTLIVVMSVINGMNLYIADHIANLGANVFVVSQFNWAAQDEEWLYAAGNAALSMTLCLAAVWLGHVAAQLLRPTKGI